MRRSALRAGLILAALAAAGCRSDDVYVPRSRTPGVNDGPSGPAPAEPQPPPADPGSANPR